MKNKILYFVLGVGLILLLFAGVQMASASITYDRTPSGDEVTSPVKFYVSLDSFSDTELSATSTYYGLWLNCDFSPDGCATEQYTECVPKTTLIHTFTANPPVGYGTDDILFSGDASSTICGTAQQEFDGASMPGETGFEVFAGGNIISVTPSSIASTTAYIGDLINSVSPFLWLIIGLPLGFWIINETMKFITPKKVKIKK